MKVNRELDTYQKATLWDWLKVTIQNIVVEDEGIIHIEDYNRLIETLERDLLD